MAPKLESCVLLDRTVELLKNRSRTLTIAKIAEDTGLTTAWLESIAQQTPNSPSVKNIVCLYEYLSGSQLIVN